MIIKLDDPILVTGASGFIGSKVVERLINHGFRNLRCLVRPSSDVSKLSRLSEHQGAGVHIDVIKGDLFLQKDCFDAARQVNVIYHLAIGAGGRSFPGAFMNAVIPTRNLLEASLKHGGVKRFVNVSSFAIYSNRNKSRWRWLDESCPIDEHPEIRGDAYAFAKLKQDQLVIDYGKKHGIPYVIVRPGVVYGPGNDKITGRVGIDTFGIFMHLGGSNHIPLTYVDNCAEAVVLAGVVNRIDGEVFNIVDDDVPSSRRFLKLYKRNVRYFKSIYVPKAISYLLCFLWEKYSEISAGQLPPVFSRNEWHAGWEKTRYSNEKLKKRLGWNPVVSTEEGLRRFFVSCREGRGRA